MKYELDLTVDDCYHIAPTCNLNKTYRQKQSLKLCASHFNLGWNIIDHWQIALHDVTNNWAHQNWSKGLPANLQEVYLVKYEWPDLSRTGKGQFVSYCFKIASWRIILTARRCMSEARKESYRGDTAVICFAASRHTNGAQISEGGGRLYFLDVPTFKRCVKSTVLYFWHFCLWWKPAHCWTK